MKQSTRLFRGIRVAAAVMMAAAGIRPVETLAQTATSPLAASIARVGQPVPAGGAPAAAEQPSRVLTMREAIDRGLSYSLTIAGLTHAADQARGRRTLAKSALMPNLSADVSAVAQQVNLSALGVRVDIPGVPFEELVRFNVVDARARVTQNVVNLAVMNTYRAAKETVRASELSVEDSRDLIALSVGSAYLESLAARARLDATRAQGETGIAIHEKASQQQASGLATPLDVNRAQAQILTARQRLALQQADFGKRKINLARMIGLPPTDRYDLAQDVPFSPAPAVAVDDAIRQAAEGRADLKAAEAQLHAAERALDAAKAERLPSVSVNAHYGANRASDSSSHTTYLVAGLLHVPLWEGGRTAGAVEQALAALTQRRTEYDDIKAQVEGDVRKAYLDIEAAVTQVGAAEANLAVARDSLALSRERFDNGISDNVAVVQSQEGLAAASYDYINSVFAHNLAKLGLARVIGRVAEDIGRYLQLP